jgi:hypothetical protein
VSKKAAQEGIKGGTINDLFDFFADKVGNNNEINANSNEVEAIRKRIQAAASARTPGIITNTPTASPIGILDRDSTHITILMAGVSSNTYQGKTENINVLTTMTVLNIGGIPMFVYVYDIYDNPSALAKIKLLTQQIVSSISPNL